jgi:hypothetical protein
MFAASSSPAAAAAPRAGLLRLNLCVALRLLALALGSWRAL